MDRQRIITVDGPAGSGKSTAAREVARRLGLPCLNSGQIYRSVTLLVLEAGADFDDQARVAEIIRGMSLRFGDPEAPKRVFAAGREVAARLKDPDVTAEVYRIANNPGYRALLVDLQRRAAEPHGIVAEGRDMGTVIFPGAQHKFYLDASPEERARRQERDLARAGHRKSFEAVLRDVLSRDRHDRDRETAPLRVPPGAIVIDTDGMSAEQVVERMLGHIVSESTSGPERERA
jgi:cytidylate kinase